MHGKRSMPEVHYSDQLPLAVDLRLKWQNDNFQSFFNNFTVA